MHGLGNDFVILDLRGRDVISVDPNTIRTLSHRRLGIGCDQLILLTTAKTPSVDVRMDIFNQDGGVAQACGNASRCVAYLLAQEDGTKDHTIETMDRILKTTTDLGARRIQVDFGAPRLTASDIPLTAEVDTLCLPIAHGALTDPVAVGVPNPHMVFFVYDVASIDVESVGSILTHHPLYPDGSNIEFVQVVDSSTLVMRVYERGTGITPACGTGAMASVVAAVRRGFVGQGDDITVVLEGGTLLINYDGKTIYMTGDVGFSYRGVVDIP